MMLAFALSTMLAQIVASPAPSSMMTASPAGASASPSASASATLPTHTPAPPRDAATIVNTGSTNTEPYTIVVSPDRRAVVTQGGTVEVKELSRATTLWLFSHLKPAQPLEHLHMRICMKSASFGSMTTIAYQGHQTGDLSCGGDSVVNELGRTVSAITAQLGLLPQIRHTRPAP
jgi:hypothetical protein